MTTRLTLAILALALVVPEAGRAAGTLLQQGGVFIGATEPGARVTLDGRPIRVAPDGRFLFGVGRDARPEVLLRIELPGGAASERLLPIGQRRYETQRIDGLPPAQVSPDAVLAERIRRESEEVKSARLGDSDEPAGFGGFVWPVTGPLSGVYGSRRILDGEPRQPHLGVDIAADSGTPVAAAAAGLVRLAEPDLFLSGGTVVIDHGYGLSTTYAHLGEVAVHPGEHVRQGQAIGRVGATGRATGPHLHWGADWYEVRLDPALLVGPAPVQKAAR